MLVCFAEENTHDTSGFLYNSIIDIELDFQDPKLDQYWIANKKVASCASTLLCMSLTMCVVVLVQGDTVYAKVSPEVDERELEKMVNPIVKEYFEHGDTREVQVQVLSSSSSLAAASSP